MASRPKRRRTKPSSTVGPSTQPEGESSELKNLVTECMAAALPIIENTVKECLTRLKTQQPAANQQSATAQQEERTDINPRTSTFNTIVDLDTNTGSNSQTTQNDLQESISQVGISKPVGLGVDMKIKAKIFANEYIKLATLIPKSNFEQEPKFKSVEKDGQLVFIKSNDTCQIKTIAQWMEAFHVFVALHCSKYPEEVGQLMTYAQIIQGISKSCGDEAAISYDEKFRQWRQVAPRACPWDRKNSELFHDAIVQGFEAKAKLKKQPFRATPSKQKYCFTFNNTGSCNKGNSCPYAHICQYCSNKHSRLQCTRYMYKQGQSNTANTKFSNNDLRKKPSTITKKD
ncbi:uncharacterized protein LOC133184330 [Saccostrea echinata]|uniref:uncharacterized protein LOC133184330 n=1 Tax=Saccostrea echinata TaxID=191078 RepID=UPI002A81FEE9|nr:uncharacterized protein LOC133184330 [Saccostrea echinata]XP_061175345.1 uncharacterized protein LOC133184330 [Saccostrea echinata]